MGVDGDDDDGLGAIVAVDMVVVMVVVLFILEAGRKLDLMRLVDKKLVEINI